MADYFRRLASNAALNRLAIVDPVSSQSSTQGNHSYAQLLLRVNVFHEILNDAAQEANRPLKGARIGLMVPPGLDFIAALLAIWSVRAIVVPICVTHPLKEIIHTVTDSGQEFIIFHADYEPRIRPLKEGRSCIDVTTIPHEARPRKRIDFSTLEWPADTPCKIIYTSGTTGRPKGVVQTAQTIEFQYRSLAETWQLTSEDRVLHVLPLHHGHGLSLSLLLPLWTGATVEFMAKFDPELVWQRFTSTSLHPVTVFMAVPTIWVKMIGYFDQHFKDHPAKAKKASDSAGKLRLAISGSAALPASIRDAWAQIANGYLLLERYGTSETGITYSERLSANGRIQGSVGWPLPGIQSRLIAEDGQDVTNIPDVMGEIQIKSGGLLKEYWGKPGAAEKEVTPDGWWRTGDLAMIKAEHNNATFIQGRASVDIIKSGGYKISGLDIETAMLELPYVKEVAVIGVPDVVWGEAVAAVCVPVEGRDDDLTIANIRENLRSQLAAYKLPQKLRIVKELPRNEMGKVQKKVLRELYFPQQREARL